jgi:hypothetical protein
MNSEPWIDALAGSVFGLVMGGLLGSWLQRLFYRPRVKIEIGHQSRYDHKGGFFISVAVTNKGANAAVDCLGSITFENLSADALLDPEHAVSDENLPKVERNQPVQPGQLLTPRDFREIDREVICWAHGGNPDKFTINPGMKTLLDVFKAIYSAETGQWYLAIPSEQGWKKLRTRLKDGNYNGKIIVSPANGKPSASKFCILSSEESADKRPKFELT